MRVYPTCYHAPPVRGRREARPPSGVPSPMHELDPPPSRNLRGALLSLGSCLIAACASSGSRDSTVPDPTGEGDPAAGGALPHVETPDGPQESIGAFLVEIDGRLRAWTNLTLTARTEADLRKWRVLEEDIVYKASNRRAELLEQLETGPPVNRTVAAMALGFVRPPEEGAKLVGPLLNALEDPEKEVVNNATVALGMLAAPETPLAPITVKLGDSSDGRLRVNAALSLRKLVEAGASWDAPLLAEARHGLVDPEPGVVAQCCLLLGMIGDEDCIDVLAPLLTQDPALVCSAAATALALLGSREIELKGDCARAMVAAYSKAPDSLQPRIMRPLIELAGVNYGDDERAWAEWSARLP